MKAFVLTILFLLAFSTFMAAVGYPIRYIGQSKELTVVAEKRRPLLCWVVRIHSGFKCQPQYNVGNDGGLQTHNDKSERSDTGNGNADLRADYSSRCTKKHFNEIAKELQLVVVHVFSRFSNHVLLCHQENRTPGGIETPATLSTIHRLHPDLLTPANRTAFLYRKESIENRLHSHAEIVSFHAEYTHHHVQRTGLLKEKKDPVTKMSTQTQGGRHPINPNNTSAHEGFSNLLSSINTSLSSISNISIKQVLSHALSDGTHSSFDSIIRLLPGGWNTDRLQDKHYKFCFALLEEYFSNCLRSIEDASKNLYNDNVSNEVNDLNCFKLIACFKMDTSSTRSISKSRGDVKKIINAYRTLCKLSSSFSVLKLKDFKSDSADTKPTKPKSIFQQCVFPVIQSAIKSLRCGATFQTELNRSFNHTHANNNTILQLSKKCASSCIHFCQLLLPELENSHHQSSSSSSDLYRTLSMLCKHIFKHSIDSKLTLRPKLRSVKDVSEVQQFKLNRRSSFLSLLSLPSSSSSMLHNVEKNRIRKRRSPSSTSSSSISFNDPAYRRQWHLHNIATPSMDVNVTSVWARGYNGSGVTVAVVDDGLQWQNEDLKANYEYRGSWDFNDDDPDPSPSTKKTANHHGTRCAGEIAAVANNSLCGVGVAYGAKIAGIRVLDGVMTDSLEAEAFNKAMEINDIYSCSWGPDDDGKTLDGPHLMAARAMRHGIEFGRHGYGSIFVVASGNGGLHHDNCNFDGYANSIYTMTIGAVDESGSMPYYAEECASMLGVTFSSGTNNERDIVTTDWTYHNPSGCTEKHTGTSAAAPLAAGMIALILQARPCLTWRDVQYVIILTAKKVDVDLAHWQENGAGLSHSHKHGFGLLSSWRMVNAARVWRLVPWMTSYSRTNDLSDGQELYIPKGGSQNILHKSPSLAVWDTVREEDVRGYSLFTVESVQVTVWLTHPCRGNLSIKLVSPSKTVSVIAAPRSNDNSSSGFQDWTFTTVRCWGESPIGNWTLIVSDIDKATYGQGKLTKWRLTLFGTPMSRSEFDERRSLVESAMDGRYLSPNHSLPCPPPPHKTEVVEPFSEKTLKIVILCGVFFLIMAVYETFEYMCCYNDEKKEFQEEVEQMQTARRMTQRVVRALENQYRSTTATSSTRSDNDIDNDGTGGAGTETSSSPDSNSRNRNANPYDRVRTINDLNALSPNSRRDTRNRPRSNCGGGNINITTTTTAESDATSANVVAVGNRGNRNNNHNHSHVHGSICDEDEEEEEDEEEDEDDLFDAAETSGLLRRTDDGHHRGHRFQGHHPTSSLSSLSSSSSLSSPRSSKSYNNRSHSHSHQHHQHQQQQQSKLNSLSQSIKSKLGNISAYMVGGLTGKNNNSNDSKNGSNSNGHHSNGEVSNSNRIKGGCNYGKGGNDDDDDDDGDDEFDIFDSSSLSKNSSKSKNSNNPPPPPLSSFLSTSPTQVHCGSHDDLELEMSEIQSATNLEISSGCK